MDEQIAAVMADTGRAVARAQDEIGQYSKQPRYSTKDARTYFEMYKKWVDEADLEAPPYVPDSRKRDQWLREFWPRQPHIAGMMNSIILVDANRGWTMSGGRNQVLRFTKLLHHADGVNWRYYARRASLSHWSTDMGSITENGREGDGGPLRAIYNVDSARCRLTGKPEDSLVYYPSGGKPQTWKAWDYFRTVSMPSDDEAYFGLGRGFLSRVLELAKLLVAIVAHDQEQLGAAMPRGLLLLQNITEEQWDDALEGREEDATATERRYFGGIMTIATSGMESPDAKLIGFSQLPAQFDFQIFMDQMMYGAALCAGYSADEFWPTNRGVLGAGKESETQERLSTSKGVTDFTDAHAEALQKELPPTIEFGYDERNMEGDLREAELAQAWAEVSTTLYEAGLKEGASLFTREEARSVMADNSTIIPHEWTELMEETELDDTEKRMRRMRDQALESPYIQRAIDTFPDEPIVVYSYKYPKKDRMVTLWDAAWRARRPARWAGARVRQAEEEDGSEVLYQDGLVTITEADVDSAIRRGRRRVGSVFSDFVEAEVRGGNDDETEQE